jgi:2-keto-4-pentenoate hydratase/2-oxohepta-3-ene-1,7-dioic acid hydratase in catechol pathway
VRLFSYIKKDQHYRIGIELQGKKYDFSRIWDYFKDIRGEHRLPDLHFLQVMIESSLFSKTNINEIITTVTNLRSLDDLILKDVYQFDVPIARPQKILCLGRNYVKHAKELKHDVPDEPIFFSKMPSSLLPHQGAIVLPSEVGRVDHEIELGVIIGKSGKNIPESQATDFIAGYTIVNDVTARDMQKADIEKKKPWLRSKSFDTFCPMGPCIVPFDAIADPHNLKISLKVNGKVRQQAHTSEMIFKIPRLIDYLSKHMTLQAGDIIATGTPEGVSELHPGDKVEGEIEYIGILENQVVRG